MTQNGKEDIMGALYIFLVPFLMAMGTSISMFRELGLEFVLTSVSELPDIGAEIWACTGSGVGASLLVYTCRYLKLSRLVLSLIIGSVWGLTKVGLGSLEVSGLDSGPDGFSEVVGLDSDMDLGRSRKDFDDLFSE